MVFIQQWIEETGKKVERCNRVQLTVIRLAESCRDNAEYYDKVSDPGYFINGVLLRQPEVGVAALCSLVAEFSGGTEAELVASVSGDEVKPELLNRVQQRQLSAIRCDKDLLRALEALLKIRLNLSNNPAMAALFVVDRMIIFMKNKGEKKAKEICLAALKKQIPFEVWEEGLNTP